MSKHITREDCRDGRKVTSHIKSSGGIVRAGKGDHAVASMPGHEQSMTYCQREMGTGLACKIYKWMVLVKIAFWGGLIFFIIQVAQTHLLAAPIG